MSAVFNFQSLMVVVLLVICTCAYVRSIYPSLLDRNRQGFVGVFWKAARIGTPHDSEDRSGARTTCEYKRALLT